VDVDECSPTPLLSLVKTCVIILFMSSSSKSGFVALPQILPLSLDLQFSSHATYFICMFFSYSNNFFLFFLNVDDVIVFP